MTAQRTVIWQLLWRMIRYAFGLYLMDTFLWVFIMGLPALPGLIIREFFNTLTSENNNQSISLQSSMMWVVLVIAVGMARIVAIFAGRITKTQHRFMMSSLLRRNLLKQLFQHPGAEALTEGSKTVSPGEVISFFRDDTAQVEDSVVGTNEIFGAGVFALVSLVILLTVNAKLTLFVFLPLWRSPSPFNMLKLISNAIVLPAVRQRSR
jgi:ABC-type multidrug transport system fused ATPase/permease subunit